MASINKITLKQVKVWEGLEGTGLSATIYYGVEPLGTVYDSGDGGPLNVRLEDSSKESVFYRQMQEYYKNHPMIDTTAIYIGGYEKYNPLDPPTKSYDDCIEPENCFIYELLDLIELEKTYKKQLKKSGHSVLIAIDPVQFKGMPCKLAKTITCAPECNIDKITSVLEAKSDKSTIRIFRSTKDFIIK